MMEQQGRVIWITGLSGAGKSTVLKCLYRDVVINKGILSLEGVNISKLSVRQIQKLRRKIGIIFQDYRLINQFTRDVPCPCQTPFTLWSTRTDVDERL